MARRNHNSRRSDAAPGWVWMLFGLGLGLIVAIGVYLRTPTATRSPEQRTVAVAQPATPKPTSTTQRRSEAAEPRTTAAENKENRFDFYEILPQFEVVVPEDDAPPATTTASRPRPAAPPAPGSFLLQAGSFGAAADADRLKASLALLGFESHVQRVTIENDTFNRVRIGPIADLDTAKRIQRQLRAAGIDPLLMKVPN
ncbi:MAG TPA: SPOR domain-containing protein [Gammaproteobacteria bacterium]|nr:SPOR domain-containing protein [Gammaproteobacteria bacterium]